MGATLTVNEGSTQMVRLVNGQLVQEESQRNIYCVPPKGEYDFIISGYALPFQMPKSPEYLKPGDSPTQTMTRIEFTIVGGKGDGKMWTELFGFSIGEKSNLGKLLRKLRVDLTPNAAGQWDLDRAIGYGGKGYGVPSEKIDETTGKPKYFKLSADTIEPTTAPESPYSIQIIDREPEPAMAGAAASNGNGNHTTSDDGWE